MRIHWRYMALLALALGIVLQTAARAVPDQGVSTRTLIPRIKVTPPKVPVPHSPVGGTVPKPGGIHAPDPIKPKPKPQPPTNPKPKPEPAPKPENSVCKRAGRWPGRCTTLDDPTWYTAGSMNKPYIDDQGGKMAHGWIDWKPPVDLTRNNPGEFRDSLLSLTKRLYDGLKAEGKIIGSGGYNLVAALYVPKAGVFISTIPRGKAADDLIADWRTAAPRLYEETEGRRVSPRTSPMDPQRLHVEDGVLYRYEKHVHGVQYDHFGDQYPSGSRIFIYGKRSGLDREPRAVPPCAPDGTPDGSTSTGRNPPCDVVLHRLGVRTFPTLAGRGTRIPISLAS